MKSQDQHVGSPVRVENSLKLALALALSAVLAGGCSQEVVSLGVDLVRASASPEPIRASDSIIPRATTTRARSTPTRPVSTRRPTATPNMTPSASPTLLPGTAPALPRIGVHFITHGDRALPYVALTFDVRQTPEDPAGFDTGIVNALQEYRAPATFFLGGDWMRTHIAETRALDANPLFEPGNHSWSHPDFRELTEARMSTEVLRAQNMMYQITGHQTVLYRFPSGWYNDLALSVVAYRGLYSIQWDVVTADPVPDNTAENILKLVRERVDHGSIIVMHANGRGWHTAEALPQMIEDLRAEGYCLVRVSQLIGLEAPPEDCTRTSGG